MRKGQGISPGLFFTHSTKNNFEGVRYTIIFLYEREDNYLDLAVSQE